MYLNSDILEIIFDKSHDKLSFSQINKYFYKKYYTNIIKLKIIGFLNKDYYKFYSFLQRYKYTKNDLDNLLEAAMNNLYNSNHRIIVWYNNTNGVHDLRYIFELIYNGAYINNDCSYYKYIVNIKKYIINNNRAETKKKIKNISYLKSLHHDFNPISKNKYKTDVLNFVNIY